MLDGKLRIYVGDMDNYYLNNAVYEVEEFLKKADPPAHAVVDYGDRAEHCWNGDHTRANAYSRLRYPQMVLPWAVERMLADGARGGGPQELALLGPNYRDIGARDSGHRDSDIGTRDSGHRDSDIGTRDSGLRDSIGTRPGSQ